jgi:hypothetical protein
MPARGAAEKRRGSDVRYYVYERIRRWVHIASFDTLADAEWFCLHPPSYRAKRPLRVMQMWPRPRVLEVYCAGQRDPDRRSCESNER